MPDNKRKRGRRDRAKVSRLESYEVEHVARKFKVKPSKVRAIIKREGNSRRKVYAALRAEA